jgi:hypothetical protein
MAQAELSWLASTAASNLGLRLGKSAAGFRRAAPRTVGHDLNRNPGGAILRPCYIARGTQQGAYRDCCSLKPTAQRKIIPSFRVVTEAAVDGRLSFIAPIMRRLPLR